MIAYAGLLVDAAEKAGMKVPPEPEKFEEYKENFPHFNVFCYMQLNQALPYPSAHFDNAKIVAAIPDDKIKKITILELFGLGFVVN